MATPVEPIASAEAPVEQRRRHSRPASWPSVSISPTASTTRPVRNGCTSTSSLRATISAADDHERERQAGRRRADQRVEAVGDPAADVAAVPADPEAAEEEPSATSPSPMSSGCWCPRPSAFFAPRLRLDARGHARPEGASFPAARHARLLRRAHPTPLASRAAEPRAARRRGARRVSARHAGRPRDAS